MFSIPSGVFSIYKEAVDAMLANDYLSSESTVVYPDKAESCSNCTNQQMGSGQGMVNRYKHGGPMPFYFGKCPMCGGNGYRMNNTTESLRLRIYWTQKEWKRLGVTVSKPESSVVIIGFLSDLGKIKMANKIILVNNAQKYGNFTFQLAGEPVLHGFGKDRYFLAILERV